MDPVSQAVLGASLSQSFAPDRRRQRAALVTGMLAGMAPDLDVLIRSGTDPLLFLEYHRQFTHSLLFIPVGALICALAFYPFARGRLGWRELYLYSFLGYATHGLLDACTSYGTQLLWPFSNARVAWNVVSIVDPLFTLPLLVLVLLAVRRGQVWVARAAFAYAVVFLAMGLVQKQRAVDAMQALAAGRGHQVERYQVKPAFANRHLWRTLYEYDGAFHVDAFRLLARAEYIGGSRVPRLELERDLPGLDPDSRQARDIERFRHFSAGYLALSPDHPGLVMDVRYSFLPQALTPLWGIEIDPSPAAQARHVRFVTLRGLNAHVRRAFFDALLGRETVSTGPGGVR
ncbi:MAG TPA: metal-dependent hydrolase [Gammaproteobacteria bacterium]|nr:metal-dependent hydrolase [Gammaproteobacteria bacterium]